MMRAKTNYSAGVEAEEVAADYLERKKFKILQRRYKTKFGEIDLVVQKSDMICFVEVKARKDAAQAMEAVTPRAQQRIEQSALYFLTQFPEYMPYQMRFDVIGILPDGAISHLDNAWEARS